VERVDKKDKTIHIVELNYRSPDVFLSSGSSAIQGSLRPFPLFRSPVRRVERERPGFNVPHNGVIVVAEEGRVANEQNVHHHPS